MDSAAGTIVAFQADSMWAVILVVSLVTLPLVLAIRMPIIGQTAVISSDPFGQPLAVTVLS